MIEQSTAKLIENSGLKLSACGVMSWAMYLAQPSPWS
jgi:hypothetical protein